MEVAEIHKKEILLKSFISSSAATTKKIRDFEFKSSCSMEFKRYFYENYFVSQCGIVKNGNGVVLKPKTDKKGYLYYKLSIEGKVKEVFAHRIVMCAWEPTVNYIVLQVNHKDFDKTNNHLSNLEWCTAQENMTHYKNFRAK